MSFWVTYRKLLIGGSLALTLIAGSAARSQQMDLSMHTVHQPYDIETFGVFRNMMLSGDFSAKHNQALSFPMFLPEVGTDDRQPRLKYLRSFSTGQSLLASIARTLDPSDWSTRT